MSTSASSMERLPALKAFPEVAAVLAELLPEARRILGRQFIGMYLYGSLAYGGFDRDSDVDFIVVTREDLPEASFLALSALHARIAGLGSWCAMELEGSYTPRRALRSFDPRRVLHVHLDRGRGEQLRRMQVDDPRLQRAWWSGWVFLRAVLWRHGVRLAGPETRVLVDPVEPGELRQAALATLECWFEPMLQEPGELLHPGYQPYCVLTMCRLLYTHELDAIASKQEAASWAQARLPEPWISLIDRAWTGRHRPERPAPAGEIGLTQDFIRFTLERSRIAPVR